MLRVHIVQIATYSNTKFHAPTCSFNSYKVIKGFIFLADYQTDKPTDWLTDGLTDWRTDGRRVNL